MSGNLFFLNQSVADNIVQHARAGKPQEVCGILRGRGAKAFAVVRGKNVAPNPLMDYVVDATTLLQQFDFEEAGDEMVGIYHSHPVSPAFPSASDAWNAHYPDCIYVICSLADEDRPALGAFRMVPSELDLDLAALRNALDFDETRPGRCAYYHPVEAALPATLETGFSEVVKPFYIIFESADGSGKEYRSRVVSIIEQQIQIVAD